MDDLDYLAEKATRRAVSDGALYVGALTFGAVLFTWLLCLACLMRYLLS